MFVRFGRINEIITMDIMSLKSFFMKSFIKKSKLKIQDKVCIWKKCKTTATKIDYDTIKHNTTIWKLCDIPFKIIWIVDRKKCKTTAKKIDYNTIQFNSTI